MAKRKSSPGSRGKKNKNQKSGGGIFLVIILAIVGGGIYIGLQKNGGVDDLNIPDIETILPQEEPGEPEYQVSSETDHSSNENSSENTSIIDRKDLNALDGKVEEELTNEAVPDYGSEERYYFTSSFDFGWPAYNQRDVIIEHQHFTLKYNEKTEQADWVAYKLTSANLANAQFKRKDNFKPDPQVRTESAHPNDYKGSGYDRGHLAPAADFTWTKSGLDETFYMSNMSPQKPGFNRGIWKNLEENVRGYAKSNKEIFVVTGPIFEGKSTKIGKNKVAVPNSYYKVILEMQGNDVKGIGFVLENEKSSETMAEYAMSIDDVEKATGLDFFPLLPDDLEKSIECCARFSDW